METTPFQSLSAEKKVDFFVKCQELLIQYHPDSPFICRADNLEVRKKFVADFLKNYKGFCYQNDNICILYNHVKVEDPKDPIGAVKAHLYKPPQVEYNGVSVDFVVFRKLEDCLGFCKAQYKPNIQYILFVKNNEVKLYETESLLRRAVNF